MQSAMAEAAAPSLLDALARAPAAAALVAAALGEADRKALRLAHPLLRDAVAEVVEKVVASCDGSPGARPPTARRWPALLELALPAPTLACLRALGAEPWPRLETLHLGPLSRCGPESRARAARALAAAAPRLAAVAHLEIQGACAAELSEIFGVEWRALREVDIGMFEVPAGAAAARPPAPAPAPAAQPLLHTVDLSTNLLTLAADAAPAARWLAARGWPLERLEISFECAAAAAALVAAPSIALRQLDLWGGLDADELRAIVNAPWPLERLEVNAVEVGLIGGDRLVLAALSRHARLRSLDLVMRGVSTTAFRALFAAAWPALAHLRAEVEGSDFPCDDVEGEALDAAAFALCPKLETLRLLGVPVGAAGARALASHSCGRLWHLALIDAGLDDDALPALARGDWPELERLDLSRNAGIRAPPTLADVRHWAPEVLEFVV